MLVTYLPSGPGLGDLAWRLVLLRRTTARTTVQGGLA
jgi:hypothetical protein